MTNYRPATAKQINLIVELLWEREMPHEAFVRSMNRVHLVKEFEDSRVLPREAASKWIERLFELPRKAATASTQTQGSASSATPAPTPSPAVPSADEVPAGRYAVLDVEGGDDQARVRFFKVDRPTEGNWAGHVFVKEQAGDDFHPVRGPRRDSVLALIARNAEAASKLYGHEIGCCGVCGRTLTDPTSRERGIGPTCAENLGW